MAQLEEQRRLRQQQQQQRQSEQEEPLAPRVPLDGFNNNLASNDEEYHGFDNDDEGFVPVGDIPTSDHDEVSETPTPDTKLASTFNTLRVLITILRPILDHPDRSNLELKMKCGPSIKKSGKKDRVYLFSRNVYACTSMSCWNNLSSEYKELLRSMDENSTIQMVKKNDRGEYELNARDWISSFFQHEEYSNEEIVLRRCLPPASNREVSSQLHEMMMHRFSYDGDGRQALLRRSIHNLQVKLTEAISHRFGHGVRLTVYGSCLSGLVLEGSHDVDVSVYIPMLNELKQQFDTGQVSAEEYEKRMRKIIFQVRDTVGWHKSRSFVDLFAITRARVPVIKGMDIYAQNHYSPDGSLSFDLCFLNEIAVVNSSLLREYSLFDNE